jgi:photosystem II stability/assembly factor-like uncharacterized protein
MRELIGIIGCEVAQVELRSGDRPEHRRRKCKLSCIWVTAALIACSGRVEPIADTPDLGLPPVREPGVELCPQTIPVTAPEQTWSPIGLSGAKINVVLPLPDGVVLAATGATRALGSPGHLRPGIYRSTDDGRQFSRVFERVGGEVRSLVASADGAIYATISAVAPGGQGGVYTSLDQGESWAPMQEGLPSWARPHSLAWAAGAPARLYLLAEGNELDPGAAVSTLFLKEGEGPWTVLPAVGIDPVPGGALTALATSADGALLYAADGARLYVSADAGQNFTVIELDEVSSPTGFVQVTGIFPGPGPSGRLFLATPEQGLFERVAPEESFFRKSGLPRAPIRALAFDGDRIWVATEGQGLYELSGGAFVPVAACLEEELVTTVAARGESIFVGTLGAGVFRKEGSTFVASRGFEELEGQILVRDTPSGKTAWYLGPAGLFRLRADRSAWDRVHLGSTHVDLVDLAAVDAETWLLASDEDRYEGGDRALGVLRLEPHAKTAASGFDGRHFGRVLSGAGGPSYVLQVRSPRDRPSEGTFGLFRSEDQGRTFVRTAYRSEDSYPSYPYFFTSAPAALTPNGTLLVGALASADPIERSLYRSEDQGQTWASVWSDAGRESPFAEANGVYADGAGRVVIAGRDRRAFLWRSDDDGRTFTSSVSNFPEEVSSIFDVGLVDDGRVVVAAGAAGVWASEDGESFSALGDALEANAHAVAVLPGTPTLVFVSTKERGILWRSW